MVPVLYLDLRLLVERANPQMPGCNVPVFHIPDGQLCRGSGMPGLQGGGPAAVLGSGP